MSTCVEKTGVSKIKHSRLNIALNIRELMCHNFRWNRFKKIKTDRFLYIYKVRWYKNKNLIKWTQLPNCPKHTRRNEDRRFGWHFYGDRYFYPGSPLSYFACVCARVCTRTGKCYLYKPRKSRCFMRTLCMVHIVVKRFPFLSQHWTSKS